LEEGRMETAGYLLGKIETLRKKIKERASKEPGTEAEEEEAMDRYDRFMGFPAGSWKKAREEFEAVADGRVKIGRRHVGWK
jgi:hypothetical protein